jgi:hypothetical protein
LVKRRVKVIVFLRRIKGGFLVKIKIAWPNEISGHDKKCFYCGGEQG